MGIQSMNPRGGQTSLRKAISRYASEFAGTFILIASIKLILGNGESSSPVAALAIGFTLMVIVYLHGHNSLGMFNPSVLIAHVIRNKLLHGISFNVIEVSCYLLAQFSGAIFGGLFIAFVFDQKYADVHTSVTPGYGTFEAFCAEFMFTIILVMANMHCAANQDTAGNQFYGLAIGGTLFVSAVAIGPITGSAINPAVWMGTVVSASVYGDPVVDDCWIYWIAHFLAGIYSGLYFTFVHPDITQNGKGGDYEKKNKSRQSQVNPKYDIAMQQDVDGAQQEQTQELKTEI